MPYNPEAMEAGYEARNQRAAENFLVNPDEKPKLKRSNEYDDDLTDQ